MIITAKDGLPYVTASLIYRSQMITLDKVLLDTGSAGTVFSSDRLLNIGVIASPEDTVRELHGIGGSEFVFSRTVDVLTVGELQVHSFEIEVGALLYGIDLDGIIGMDFLMQVSAVIDLGRLELRSAASTAS